MQAGERRTFRWIVAALLGAAIVGAFVGSEFEVAALLGSRARHGASTFLSECWPPRVDADFLALLWSRTLDTVAMALLGTVVAMAVGLPLGIFASRSVVYGALFATGETNPGPAARFVFWGARAVCAVFRSIPEVIWALLFVRIVGLGPLPAVAALGVAYGGLIGKVYSEQFENVAPRPVAALEAVGAGRARSFAWGVLPQAFGPMVGYAVYRFECAVRASVLMGFVGAGGLGYELQVSYGDYLFGEVMTETALLVGVVALIEIGSDALRRATS